MKQVAVSATVPKNEKKGIAEDKSATINVNYVDIEDPGALKEAEAAFGSKALLSNAFANWRVTLQAGVRRSLIAGKTQEQIAQEFADAKMGVATMGAQIDPLQASLAKFKTMTPEERKAYMAMLREAAQA